MPPSPARTKMTAAAPTALAAASAAARGPDLRRVGRALLPSLSLALVLAAIALATMAQMFVMATNDIDLSIGTFVGFVCCVTATYLNDDPLIGALILAGCIGAYAALGALIFLRALPSIVV